MPQQQDGAQGVPVRNPATNTRNTAGPPPVRSPQMRPNPLTSEHSYLEHSYPGLQIRRRVTRAAHELANTINQYAVVFAKSVISTVLAARQAEKFIVRISIKYVHHFSASCATRRTRRGRRRRRRRVRHKHPLTIRRLALPVRFGLAIVLQRISAPITHRPQQKKQHGDRNRRQHHASSPTRSLSRNAHEPAEQSSRSLRWLTRALLRLSTTSTS